jgi:hypothetical protein
MGLVIHDALNKKVAGELGTERDHREDPTQTSDEENAG